MARVPQFMHPDNPVLSCSGLSVLRILDSFADSDLKNELLGIVVWDSGFSQIGLLRDYERLGRDRV